MAMINIEKAVENYREFLNVVNERMEKSGEGVAVPTTVFAKEVAAQFDTEWSVIYNLCKFVVASDIDLEIKKGPTGGMVRKAKEAPVMEAEKAIEHQ